MFIKIPNNLITDGKRKHMSDRELYLYSLLWMDKRLDGQVITSLTLQSKYMLECTGVAFSKREQRNMQLIKEALISMSEKEIISIKDLRLDSIEPSDVKNSDVIIIEFKRDNTKGHAQIPHEIFYKCKTTYDLYIYTAVKRWENSEANKKGVLLCDYERFARIIGVSRATAYKHIESAIERELIYRNTGDYINDKDEIRQEQNEYRCTPFSESEKSLMTKKKAKEARKNRTSHDNVLEDCDYGVGDLEDAIYWWSAFKELDTRTGEEVNYIPDSEAQLIHMEVIENTRDRYPTKAEYKLIDTANWRTKIIMNSNNERLMNEFEYQKEIAQEKLSSKLSND